MSTSCCVLNQVYVYIVASCVSVNIMARVFGKRARK